MNADESAAALGAADRDDPPTVIDRLLAHIDALTAERDQLRIEQQETQDSRTFLYAEIDTLTAERDQLQFRMDRHVRELMVDITELRAERDRESARLADQVRERDAARAERNRIARECADLRDELADVKTQLVAAREDAVYQGNERDRESYERGEVEAERDALAEHLAHYCKPEWCCAFEGRHVTPHVACVLVSDEEVTRLRSESSDAASREAELDAARAEAAALREQVQRVRTLHSDWYRNDPSREQNGYCSSCGRFYGSGQCETLHALDGTSEGLARDTEIKGLQA